jgi:hypothetical protein
MTTHTPGRAATSPVAEAADPDDSPAAAQPPPRQFGLPTASALVVGSVIGTGVFALPSALAGYGPMTASRPRPSRRRTQTLRRTSRFTPHHAGG